MGDDYHHTCVMIILVPPTHVAAGSAPTAGDKGVTSDTFKNIALQMFQGNDAV